MYRFRDWPLRAKIATLLVVASLLPLGVATWISISYARTQLLSYNASLLAARADYLVGRIDTFNRGYLSSVSRLARARAAREFAQATPEASKRLLPEFKALLRVWPDTDSGIRGAALLDPNGNVTVATEDHLIGTSLAYRSFVKEALLGNSVTSDVYFAEPEVGSVPTIAFIAPVRGPDQKVTGLAAIWVHASALHKVLRESNQGDTSDSFAVLFDHFGIRMAHSFDEASVFHPDAPLSPETINVLVAEQRFGAQTRQLLEDRSSSSVRSELTSRGALAVGMFRVYAPANKQWNYAVGRKFSTVTWTAYYMLPESVPQAEIVRITQQKLLFAAVILLASLALGAWFAAAILKPVRLLSAANRALAGGDRNARVVIERQDELGELGGSFNSMAACIQEQAAALAKETEAQYRSLFDSLIEGFCTAELIRDQNGKVVDFLVLEVNPAFEKQTGLHDVTGRRILESVPGMGDRWFAVLDQVAKTGQPVQFDNAEKQLSRYFDERAYRIGGQGSDKVAILFNDVTARMEAQGRQQAHLEHLDMLQEITRAIGERHNLPSIYQVVIRKLEDQLAVDFCCICLYEPVDNRLIVTRVGQRSQALALDLGLSEQTCVDIDENGLSRCVRGHVVYEPDVVEARFPFPQRLARGGLRALVAAPLQIEGRVFGVLVTARREANSFSSGECEFLRQLSDHVALAAHHAQLYVELQRAYEELRETQEAAVQHERLRALGQMASGIAHDINNAISPVALYTEMLLEKEAGLSAQGRGYLQTIQLAIQDVAATVARMREFYRQREPQYSLLPVQLNDLVRQVTDLTRARWSDMAQQLGIMIDLRTELALDLPAIMGAEGEVREVLVNLVFNAVDAMPRGGVLALRTRAAGVGHVEVEVSDTGIGMNEDARRRCLEPFFTTKGERGTGLGLAMVYGVVQRHGAEIEIDSELGVGTTVRLRFAVATASAVSASATVVPVPTGLRMLVVDDDPVLLRSLSDTLTGDGHVVVAASGGQEGMDLFRASLQQTPAFDVVLTDLGMPHVDGRAVAAAVKAMSPTIPVIMLTGWGQRLVAEGDLPEHADLVLGKPPRLRDLREALTRSCRTLKS